MPFARIELKSLIPKPYDFVPVSVGDHIRKKRLQSGLHQKEVAQQLEVNSWTVLNWEKGHTEPPVCAMPAVIRFLGYQPFPSPKTLPEKLLAVRRTNGWSIIEAANHAGVDPGTWAGWERGKTVLYRRHRVILARLLDIDFSSFDKEMALRWGG